MKNHNQVIKALFERRSIRELQPDPLPRDHIELLLSCLESAPSAGNLQPWRFYVVQNPALKKELCALSFDQKAVEQAPVVFAVSAVPAESAAQYGELGSSFFCIQDTAAAVENLLLAAHSLEYGAVWIGVVKEKEIAALLNMEPGEKPVALIPVGRPAQAAGPMERRGWDQVTKFLD